MPPSRALALVEYGDAKAAKKAFSALAYSRFQREPLYLEWAPESVFLRPVAVEPTNLPQLASNSNSSGIKPGAWEDLSATLSSSVATEDVASPLQLSTAGHTVFVKNLSFSTTEEALKLMMAKAGPLRTVRIPKRRNPKFREGEKGGGDEFQSLGYGFAEFSTKEAADAAMRKLQGKELDGHALQLSVSIPKATESVTKPLNKPQSTTKDKDGNVAISASKDGSIIVRNLAFESTKKELMELFSAFGTVRSLRLPKKFDGTHRGFAFVDFLTNAEAKEAMRALSATHLYGRKLVLEWAEQTKEEPK
jgi:multiple RNA-binding domain-containing protein 1